MKLQGESSMKSIILINKLTLKGGCTIWITEGFSFLRSKQKAFSTN